MPDCFDHPASQDLKVHVERCIPQIQTLWLQHARHPAVLAAEHAIVAVRRYADRTSIALVPYDLANPPAGMSLAPESASHIASALAEPDSIPVVAGYSPAMAALLGVDPCLVVSAPLP